METILESYKDDIFLLEKITGKSIMSSKKGKDEITLLSTISEIKFGKYLLKKFGANLKFEPEISGKTPDWLVTSNNDEIIFEVMKINLPNEKLREKISASEVGKVEIKSSGAFFRPAILNLTDFHKILKKEIKYRALIEENSYKLVICIDTSDWEKTINIRDISDSLDYYNTIDQNGEFRIFFKNVSGLLVLPFVGNTEFILNKKAEGIINPINLNILMENV